MQETRTNVTYNLHTTFNHEETIDNTLSMGIDGILHR